MNSNLNITITELQEKILLAFKERFPKISVESYDAFEDLSELAPACLLDLEEFPKGDDVGDGRYPATCRLSIHCVLGYEVSKLQLELREFAMSVSQFISNNSIWIKSGVVSPAKKISAYPGNFKKSDSGKSSSNYTGFDSWVVSWEQNVFIGESEWEPSCLETSLKT